MYYSSKGANLIEYVIPLALVGVVVGLGMFYLFSSGTLANFLKGSMGAHDNGEKVVLDKNVNETTIISEQQKAYTGSGGSEKDPQAKCSGNSCSIDFGSYTLSGIPADFTEYIESAATSGGTKKLAELLKQIADNANIDEESKNLIKQLAEKGHGLATIEENAESEAHYYRDFPDGVPASFENYAEKLLHGIVRKDFDSLYSQIVNNLKSSTDEDKVVALSVVQLLGTEIKNLANSMEQTLNLVDSQSGASSSAEVFENIVMPPLSTYNETTDLHSGIICLKGRGSDTGKKCY